MWDSATPWTQGYIRIVIELSRKMWVKSDGMSSTLPDNIRSHKRRCENLPTTNGPHVRLVSWDDDVTQKVADTPYGSDPADTLSRY